MLEEIIKERKKKLDNFKKEGFYPYPEKVKRTHKIKELLDGFDKFEKSQKEVFVCGRIIGFRDQGKIVFIDVVDESGKIQGVFNEESIEKHFKLFKENLDIGDFIQISGFLFLTKKQEKSVKIKSLIPIVKSLRSIPSHWYGLEDIEIRLRQRYLDILVHPEVKELFVKKNIFWKSIREFLQKENFLEMETPILEVTPGGADAEPFITHHNTLNTDFYLRISLEISLKKLLVAGYEKIFEIGRIFRNEGIDAEHLQDYTQMEFYWAYSNCDELMDFVQKMYQSIIKDLFSELKTEYQGKKLDWSGNWERIEYFDIFKEKTNLDINKVTEKELFKKAEESGLKPEKNLSKGRLIDLLFKKMVRPYLIQPCFLINQPIEIEPLAKRIEDKPGKVARFQILAAGSELGKGFSEANDPVDQRERFEEQMRLRKKGDKEAQRLDEDFLQALEYGMPPAGGFGLSERLFAVLMDKPIRETTIFPLMKNKKLD
ncbi:lysine--tRNA ligase [Candidatus Wolfebacteria bacterium]|nr:lysine--tRNA ligase [Candidatus Wolfebacteria bacterium]